MLRLKTLKIKNVNLDSSILIDEIKVSYETFGQEISKKPIVLIIHPLTGNSSVCGKNGWWKQIVKNNGSIDTNKYSILAFNIPGNGYDGILYDNYSIFNTGDVAKIFFKANKFQSGFIYQYAFVMLIGFSALLTFLIVK